MAVSPILFSSERGDWRTPKSLFERLDAHYHFTLDVAASAENALCERYFDVTSDGLAQSWQGETVFMNPPYGQQIKLWTAKALHEASLGGCTVVGLLPSRTDTQWFHRDIYRRAELQFLKGRLKFDDGKNSAPFPSMIAVWGERA